MKNWLMAFMASTLFLVSGCGKGREWHSQSSYPVGICGADITVYLNYADALYYDNYKERLGCDIVSRWSCSDTAFAKRGAALNMAKEVYSYSFKNYVLLDGVSGFLYNLCYIVSIPHKLLRGLMCLDGVGCYIGGVAKLGIGLVASVIGLVAAPVINTICHPLETLANVTVGLPVNFLEDYDMPWWYYMGRTNLVATLWDLGWGAILHPLIQAVLFFR